VVEDHFPSEEEQYQAYRKSAECIGDRDMVIRVLDVGSDKLLSYFERTPAPRHRSIDR
jgi:phosphotransferase system enzyme I (PtsI)